MNLKEAFRFQNKLRDLSTLALDILSDGNNVTRTQKIYLRSRVMPEAEDETEVKVPPSRHADHINELCDFLLYLLNQQDALGKAIRAAKAGLELDMDLETNLNHQRQSVAAAFRTMANLRSSEVLIPNGGTGLRFNAEGNQVPYRCDSRVVTTINFDRNSIRKLATGLYQQADAISTRLDVVLVTAQVDYTPPFNVNDTFDTIFEQFLSGTY